jgi:hypothetical protein
LDNIKQVFGRLHMEMKRQSHLTVEAILSIDVELELVVFISYVLINTSRAVS